MHITDDAVAETLCACAAPSFGFLVPHSSQPGPSAGDSSAAGGGAAGGRGGGPSLEEQLEPKVVEVYRGVGRLLARYKAGKIPKVPRGGGL